MSFDSLCFQILVCVDELAFDVHLCSLFMWEIFEQGSDWYVLQSILVQLTPDLCV